MSTIIGTIFNIQRYSLDDGPGIRTTVFLKGCPLECLWCSNPESQNPWPEVTHRDASCIKCGRCVEVCPVQAISINENAFIINREKCTRCAKCTEVCSAEALKIIGKEMSVEEVFIEVMRDIEYYQNSGGGITVSGGEVLTQPEFAANLLKKCRDAGMHTCLDTSGYGDTGALKKILPYTSLVLFDLKHMDPTAHHKLTGQSNELILRNLQVIVESGVPVMIRVPIIPGLNDSEENIKAIARTVSGMTTAPRIDLLPYHRYGMGKYKMLDLEYQLADIARPSDEQLDRAKEIVESYGLGCEIVV
ncbi:MAG: glycyl-radical enzyme activating protein [Clostridia bacterium]|nr:glycyl-radical enzyme activating protein [Clostridia bacterium]